MGAMRGKALLHVCMERLYRIFIVVAARNTGLVRDNKYVVSGFVQQPDGFERSIDPFKLFGSVGIAVVDVENAIAIEKCRRPAYVNSFRVFVATAFLVGHWFNGLRMPNLLVQVARLWHRAGAAFGNITLAGPSSCRFRTHGNK